MLRKFSFSDNFKTRKGDELLGHFIIALGKALMKNIQKLNLLECTCKLRTIVSVSEITKIVTEITRQNFKRLY